eukprot:jgi/Mesvir1/29252/Mv06888-RA.1
MKIRSMLLDLRIPNTSPADVSAEPIPLPALSPAVPFCLVPLPLSILAFGLGPALSGVGSILGPATLMAFKASALAVKASAVAALVTAAVPTALSSLPGLNLLLHFINKRLAGRLVMKVESLGWTVPLHLRDVKLLDPTGQVVLSLDYVKTTRPLWQVLLHLRTLGGTSVGHPFLDLSYNEFGQIRLAAAFVGMHTEHDHPPIPLQPTRTIQISADVNTLDGPVEVKDGELLVTPELIAVLGSQKLHLK